MTWSPEKQYNLAMSIAAYFLNPLYFFSLLGILFLASILMAVSSLLDYRRKTATQGELSAKIANLQGEVEKLKSELSVRGQMYDGLKGQYEELEKDFEKIMQEPKGTAVPAKAPNKSVVSLLQDLQDIQNPSANKNPP